MGNGRHGTKERWRTIEDGALGTAGRLKVCVLEVTRIETQESLAMSLVCIDIELEID